MIMLYAGVEASILFSIRSNLDVACRRAGAILVKDYVDNGNTTVNDSSTPAPLKVNPFNIMATDGHYFVHSAANQFQVKWNPPDAQNRKSVTVFVSYPNNDSGHNIVRFPYPDPLNLGGQFKIWTAGTFAAPG